MNLEQTDKQLVDSFFDQQLQPAFWMVPVWDQNQQITDFEYRYCNQEFYRYTGLPQGTIVGKRLSSSPVISNPEQRKMILMELLDVFLNDRQKVSRLYNSDINRYYSYTRNRVQDGVLTVLQDRTEEQQMLRQLEEHNSLVENILKHSSNAISVGKMIRNEKGEIIDVQAVLANEAAIRNTGIPRESYLSKTAAQLDPNFLNSPYFQLCMQCMQTGEPAITQYFLASVAKWMEVSISKMDEAHQIYIFTDVTPIKEAQLRVETVAARLEAVFKAAQAGMFIIAPVHDAAGELVDFRFVITNPNFAAYAAATPEIMAGALVSDFFPGYLHNGTVDMYKTTYLTGQTLRQDFHYDVDQFDLYLDLQSIKVHDEVLVTFTDYTPLKKAQLELERSVDELKHLNANLEQFVYAASHDLKEPLRKIHFFSDRLKSQLADRIGDSEKASMDRIENASRRMTLLVDDLLEYSHVNSGVDLTEDIDLNLKLRLVLDDLELVIKEKQAVIHLCDLPTIHGHRRQIQQLFQNLISNALKYSKEEVTPVIQFSAQRLKGKPEGVALSIPDGDYHLIAVQDNGIGFEQADAGRIFNVFTRLHGKAEYSGTGVGLSIVRKVVENHKGFIWARSVPGEGATFFVLLPA
jgi:signal transduction histidine kinase